MFKYPIPPHSLTAWKTHVVVESHSATSLAIATANAILNSLGGSPPKSKPANTPGHHLGGREAILSLAADLQNILGDAMDMAKTMFPLKATTSNKGRTLPHHLWPESVLHDVYAIRNRTKALRRLATLVAATPSCGMEFLSDT
jgi:hypothetical protein